MDVVDPEHLGFTPSQTGAVTQHSGKKDHFCGRMIPVHLQGLFEALELPFRDEIR